MAIYSIVSLEEGKANTDLELVLFQGAEEEVMVNRGHICNI